MRENAPQFLSLKVNFSWTLAGNLIFAGCQWGILVELAQIGTPAMVGQFALGLAVTAPVFMFFNLQLRGVLATDARGLFPFSAYFTLRLITTISSLALIFILLIFLGYDAPSNHIILAVALSKAMESFGDILYGLLQKYEKMNQIAISMAMKGILSLFLMGSVLYLSQSVFLGVVSISFANLSILIFYDFRMGRAELKNGFDTTGRKKRISPFSSKELFDLAKLALPLGGVMMMISLNTNIPRYYVEKFLGTDSLGIFAAIAYLMVAGTMIINALGQSATPRLARHIADRALHKFRSLLKKLVYLGGLLGILGILVAQAANSPLLTFLYGPEYGECGLLFLFLMVAAGLAYVASFLGYGMTSARLFRPQLPLFLIVVLTSWLSSAWLIPAYGLNGAALSLIISALVQGIGALIVLLMASRFHKRNVSPLDEE